MIDPRISLFALVGLTLALVQLCFIVLRQYVEWRRQGGELVRRTRPVKAMLLAVGAGSLLTLPLAISVYVYRVASLTPPPWLNDAAVAVRVLLTIVVVNMAFAVYYYKMRKQL